MYNILVCDDDKEIVEAIEIYLKLLKCLKEKRFICFFLM